MSKLAQETSDIQGVLFSGYRNLFFSSYHLLAFSDPARARRWLGLLAARVTSGHREVGSDGRAIAPERAINVALSYKGILALGYPADDAEDSFAEEFRQGMADESRARRLGDTGGSAPSQWEFGGPKEADTIHALLILQAPTDASLQSLITENRQQFTEVGGLREVAPPQFGVRRKESREHFGFFDGISNPGIEGAPGKAPSSGDVVKAGEFILGYLNEYGTLPPTPTVVKSADVGRHLRPVPHASELKQSAPRVDFGKNGAYLVFRKLHQDVALFRLYVAENGADHEERAAIAAKFVGRWPSGAPLVLFPDRDRPPGASASPENDFLYTPTDRQGFACPVGSHIRRSNPRDAIGEDPHASLSTSNRHRILRRGVAYGDPLPDGVTEDDEKERGLLFLCLNADIGRQFEFIQQTWCNNSKFAGLYDDKDPLIGDNFDPLVAGDVARHAFTIQRSPTRMRLENLPRFVTMRGGAYLFLPSISALRFLAELIQG